MEVSRGSCDVKGFSLVVCVVEGLELFFGAWEFGKLTFTSSWF